MVKQLLGNAGRTLLAASIAFGPAFIPASAQENFSNKSLNLIIPFGPGAATDNVARIVDEGLSRQLGQTVIATNKPGANGMIAVRAAQATPSNALSQL